MYNLYMRFPRLSYPGAFHHATNRGINGENILASDGDKRFFLELLARKSKTSGIRVFAYCLMDNHYHLVVENSSGRLSQFFKQLNGHYGLYYRQKTGSQGYVFQGRYFSSLIQDDSYLTLVIKYVLLNPVKAGSTPSALAYPWSSAGSYFSKKECDWLATDFVEGLFGSRLGLDNALSGSSADPLPVIKTRFGPVVGSEDFPEKAAAKFERRRTQTDEKRKRSDEKYFEPAEKVIQEFEKKHKLRIDKIDHSMHSGKRLRGELLVWLHDLAGLKYSEIIELPFFFDLKFHSLGHIYKNAKRREGEKYKN
jgi:REP element-mobilizing transposase RayT